MIRPSESMENTIRRFIEEWALLNNAQLSEEERSKLDQTFSEDYIRIYDYIRRKITYGGFKALGEEADDISQDIIEEIMKRSDVFRPDIERPVAYLNTTIRNRCIDRIRKKKPDAEIKEDTLSEEEVDLTVKLTLEKNVVPELDDVCLELLMGSCLGKTIEQMKKESKSPKSIHHPNMKRCRELLRELLEKQGLADMDLQVLAELLCESLEKF